MSTALSGRAAAPGAVAAPVFVLEANPAQADPVPQTRSGSAEEEKRRLSHALDQARSELLDLAGRVAEAAGEEEGDIFEAHADFASDPEIASQAQGSIRAGASAERAVIQAFETFRQLLSASTSTYLAERAADLDDVRDRVVAILLGRSTAVPIPQVRSVIVAGELTPSQTASVPRALIAGIVTETGSPTSHAAILARSLGIPAVVACGGLLDAVVDGVMVALDGRDGTVIVDPDEDQLDAIEERSREEDKRRAELTSLREERGRTKDGRRVELAANIGSPQDLAQAIESGAEGSGLVRTEFLFLGRRTPPSVDEQTQHYKLVLQAFPGSRVVFRTMDIGADKPLPFVAQEPEENPALGLRGIRLSLSQPDLFRDQARALLRAGRAEGAGAGTLAIMFPMISSAAEFLAARTIVTEAADEEGVDAAGIEIGAMIEVPAAAMAAERVAAHADFLSIGTNDLLQYLFAADRLNRLVAEVPDVCEPDILALIGHVIDAGHSHGAWVGVCGEAANDPIVAAAFVGLGADELSMTRVAIPEIKDMLMNLTFDRCRAAVTDAMAGSTDAAEVRRYLEESLGGPAEAP